MSNQNVVQFTGYFDKNGIPVAVNDLVRIKHFVARHRRQVYMHKKVLIIDNGIYLVEVQDLGLKPVSECHKCLMQEYGNELEVMDGHSCNHPVAGYYVAWWERKRIPKDFISANTLITA